MNVTVIDEGVFKNCSNLKTVTIPDSLTEINAMAFEGCYKIKTINQSAQYEIKDKCVIRKKDHALVYVLPQKGKLKIPNGVKTIQRYAFCTCTSSEVTIPASVTHIGSSAFEYSYSLESVAIYGALASFGSQAFRDCMALKNVSLAPGITSLGSAVFVNCYSLKKITLPNSITTINSEAFRYCRALKEVNLPANL